MFVFKNEKRRTVTTLSDKKSLKTLGEMYQYVGTGEATDYDQLAIKLGDIFFDNFGVDYPFMSQTLQSKHVLGSKFLQGMREQGHIRIENRGTVRRAAIDIDTGRPSAGGWKDTVSREVVVVNKDMRDLQKAYQRANLAPRLGIIGSQNSLHGRRGSIHYYDSTGRKTSHRLVTRNASTSFDPKMIDQDILDFINKGMSFEYVTDQDFAPFMQRVLYFRDPRGNTEYYDDLNSFRHVIVKRGEQGSGMMQAVRWHTNRGQPFRARAQIDGRGRLYFNGYLQPTGGEVVRPFLNTSVAKQVSPDGVREIQYHLGALLGDGNDALSNAGRLAVFRKHEKDLLDLADNVLATTQPDRRVREFLENPIIRELDGEEVPIVTRMALEYKRIYDHTGGDVYNVEKLRGYRTQLLNEVDASASAVQMISLATGNKNLATVSNVLATRQKNRIYDLVAQDTKSDARYLAIEEKLGIELAWEELAKGAKLAVMLRGYGSGVPGINARVSKELADVLQKRDILVFTRADYLRETKVVDRAIDNARRNGLDLTEASLIQLREEMEEMMKGSTTAARAALELAEEHSPDSARFVEQFLAPRNGLVSPEDFKEIASIMLDHLESRAPGMDDYINFFKQAAVKYIQETGDTTIPFRTFDGKAWELHYRPKVEHEVRFWDPAAKRYVKNIVKGEVRDGKLLGKMSISKARTGFGVSFTHANDAAILRMMYRKAAKEGVDMASVHDAVVSNLEDITTLRRYGREAYATARDSDVIQETLREMRKQGLSRQSYAELLELGTSSGLFLDDFLASEIIEDPTTEHHYYGWDY